MALRGGRAPLPEVVEAGGLSEPPHCFVLVQSTSQRQRFGVHQCRLDEINC